MSLAQLSRFFAQSFWLPTPTLTEHNLPDQSGRVVIVTGGYAGVGYELSRILYLRNASVYIAGRSRGKAEKAIAAIKAVHPDSRGRLEFLQLDLSDLSTIKGSAEEFKKKEARLDVLVNNAGVGQPPLGSKSTQGHELQMSTNCLGPFLFTKLLLPLLKTAATDSPPGATRVIWAGSLVTDVQSPPNGGIDMDPSTGAALPSTQNPGMNYGMSKVGNLYLSSQLAFRHPLDKRSDGKGIVSHAFNPGNLRTELLRHVNGVARWLMEALLLYPAIYGAYTELWAGWSEEAGRGEMNGGYVWPWGRFGGTREDIEAEMEKGKEGEGKAVKFWEWCEEETKPYL